MLVGGDAGIGKSTLVAEGARRVGAELVVGRCVPMGGELIPLAPLVDCCATCANGPGRAERTDSGPVAGLATPEAATGGAGLAAGGLFGPVLDLVGSLAGDGVVVVAVEDLHGPIR